MFVPTGEIRCAKYERGVVSVPVAWFLAMAGAVIAGASIVALLVARSTFEPVAFASAALSAAVSGYGLLVLAGEYDSFPRVLLAAGMGIAAAVGGYWLAAALLPFLDRGRSPARIPTVTDDDRGPAYVLLSRAEPERYSPSWTASFVDTVAGTGTGLIPSALLPFLFAAEKARYRATEGRSPARQTVHGLAQRLSMSLKVPEVHVAFCEPRQSLANAVRSAALAGHRRVVVAALGIGEGRPEEVAKETLEAADPAAAGVEILYADPLWSSTRLPRLVAERALTFAGEDPLAGIALVLEGQPPLWDEAHPDFDQQEGTFAGRVERLIVEGGVPEDRVRTCWLDWRSPDVIETVRHLDALGSSRIGLVPATAPTDTLITLLDLPRAAETARGDAETRVLPPWGNDAVVAEEIVASMRAALDTGA